MVYCLDIPTKRGRTLTVDTKDVTAALRDRVQTALTNAGEHQARSADYILGQPKTSGYVLASHGITVVLGWVESTNPHVAELPGRDRTRERAFSRYVRCLTDRGFVFTVVRHGSHTTRIELST